MTLKQSYEIFFGKIDNIPNSELEIIIKSTLTEKSIKTAYRIFSISGIHPDYSHLLGIKKEDANLIFDEINQAKSILLSCLNNSLTQSNNVSLKFDQIPKERREKLQQKVKEKLKLKQYSSNSVDKLLIEIKSYLIKLKKIREIILTNNSHSISQIEEITAIIKELEKVFHIPNHNVTNLENLKQNLISYIEKLGIDPNQNKEISLETKKRKIEEFYEIFIKHYILEKDDATLIVSFDLRPLSEITELYKNYQANSNDTNAINETYNLMLNHYANLPNHKQYTKEEEEVIKSRIINNIIKILKSYNDLHEFRTNNQVNIPPDFKIVGILSPNSLYNQEELSLKTKVLSSYNITYLYLLLDIACQYRQEEINLNTFTVKTH